MERKTPVFSPEMGEEKYPRTFSVAIMPMASVAELLRRHYDTSSMEPSGFPYFGPVSHPPLSLVLLTLNMVKKDLGYLTKSFKIIQY